MKIRLSLFISRGIRFWRRRWNQRNFSENWNKLCNERKDMLSKIRGLRRHICTSCRYCHCRSRSLRVPSGSLNPTLNYLDKLAARCLPGPVRDFAQFRPSWRKLAGVSQAPWRVFLPSFRLQHQTIFEAHKYAKCLSKICIRVQLRRGHATNDMTKPSRHSVSPP